MRHQFNFVRAEELRAMLAEIDAADSRKTIGPLYFRIVGYYPFEEMADGDCLDDIEDVRMMLCDYVKDIAVSEGFYWSEIADVDRR